MAFLGSADHHVRCGRQEVIDEMRTIQKSVKSYLPPRYLREDRPPAVPRGPRARDLIMALEDDDGFEALKALG